MGDPSKIGFVKIDEKKKKSRVTRIILLLNSNFKINFLVLSHENEASCGRFISIIVNNAGRHVFHMTPVVPKRICR